MLWDIYQQLQIEGLQAQQRMTNSRLDIQATRHRHHADDTQDDIMRLVLITQAMFELLHERLGITSDELLERIHAIDARDGVADGRLTARPRPCPSCEAMVPADRDTCQFCGAAAPGRDPFR
jgi:hypothetical protein